MRGVFASMKILEWPGKEHGMAKSGGVQKYVKPCHHFGGCVRIFRGSFYSGLGMGTEIHRMVAILD